MNISELLELEKKKAQLQKKKEAMIRKAFHKKKLDQINADQDSVKKGYIQKTKFIAKKQYEVIQQKARTKIPVQIQDNASVSSYLINNSNFEKIYQRTKKLIEFDEERMKNSVNALRSFAQQKFEKILHVKIIFANQINHGSVIRPFQLNLPNKIKIPLNKKLPIPKAIILVNDAKTLQKNPNYKSLTCYPIQIKEYKQFVNDWKNDKDFKKKLTKNRILILCEWDIFAKSSKIVTNLLNQGFAVFPFDTKKVPYFVSQTYENIDYQGYLKLMLQNQYALIKSGKEHSIHLKLDKQQSNDSFTLNIKQAIVQTVSKLLERNKDKSGNRVVKIQAKTNVSINFVLYQNE